MHSSDVHEWIKAYERSRRTQAEAHRELDRLGLITRDDERDECDLEIGGHGNRERAGWEESQPPLILETVTRMALLIGTAMIAALAIYFG
jgi:hypothetical protein